MTKQIATLKEIAIILGERFIVPSEAMSDLFRINIQPKFVVDESVILDLAEQNRRGRRFIAGYAFSLPILQQMQLVGTDPAKQPCFCTYDHEWWKEMSHDELANSVPDAGLALLDLNGRFGRESWASQEKLISNLGPNYERADERILTQICLGYHAVFGEYPVGDWFHWGRIACTPRDERACIRGGSEGLVVTSMYAPLGYYTNQLVVVGRRCIANHDRS